MLVALIMNNYDSNERFFLNLRGPIKSYEKEFPKPCTKTIFPPCVNRVLM